ncbi:hypothetical protein Patl1_23838 [Pistacia atlantica]|uniref:Uncharacterized protein n=1 Tax=Pistacia atlantica TaxID=434234 RepID=A0ACC0ZV60_9ROSI|nr:hypothetical protein Patl1_23838 [Pistacia atlantica]
MDFQRALVIQTSIYVELMAVIQALEMPFCRGWSFTWLECDSLSIVASFQSSYFSPPWQIRIRWFNCLTKLLSINFHVSHIYREGNQGADTVANLGLLQNGFTWWDKPPANVHQVLFQDTQGFTSFCFV